MPDLDFGGKMSVADFSYLVDTELMSIITAEERLGNLRTHHMRADNEILCYDLFLHQNIHRVHILSTTATQTLSGPA
jgi:hypothetical protein